jgi:hypothetical protein
MLARAHRFVCRSVGFRRAFGPILCAARVPSRHDQETHFAQHGLYVRGFLCWLVHPMYAQKSHALAAKQLDLWTCQLAYENE